MEHLKQYITSYRDFPKKGVIFQDVLEILQQPDVFDELIKNMSKSEFFKRAEAIVSIDARGFIFGSAISLITKKPLIVARKPQKLPGELITRSYDLEYGSNTLCIQKKSLEKFNFFAIVDDLLATGGTAKCVGDLLTSQNKEVISLITIIELESLTGRNNLNFPVHSELKYD